MFLQTTSSRRSCSSKTYATSWYSLSTTASIKCVWATITALGMSLPSSKNTSSSITNTSSNDHSSLIFIHPYSTDLNNQLNNFIPKVSSENEWGASNLSSRTLLQQITTHPRNHTNEGQNTHLPATLVRNKRNQSSHHQHQRPPTTQKQHDQQVQIINQHEEHPQKGEDLRIAEKVWQGSCWDSW